MARKSENEGAAAAMEYLRALRGEDDVPLDTEEVPLLSGPDAVPARVAAAADEGVDSGVGSGALGSSPAGDSAVSSGGARSGGVGSGGAGSGGAGSGGVGSGAAADDSVGAVGVALAEEWVTCPECGTAALIDPAQRRAEDFCANCDFPLFWARSAVIAMEGHDTGASLRRLPGTVGRAATAGVACPHCGEMNSPVATVCVRCGLPMVIVEPEPEPEPEPVYVAPEPVEPEPEPEPEFPFIWVLVICMVVLAVAVGLTLYFQFG